jgi:hypothetical protein
VLDLTENEEVTDEGIAALVASPGLCSVAELFLGGKNPWAPGPVGPARISDRGMAALARSPQVTGLRYLWLERSFPAWQAPCVQAPVACC